MFFYAGVVISIIIVTLHRIHDLDKMQTAVKPHLDLICNYHISQSNAGLYSTEGPLSDCMSIFFPIRTNDA